MMRVKLHKDAEFSVELRKALAAATALLRHAYENLESRPAFYEFRARDVDSTSLSHRCLFAESFPDADYLDAGVYAVAFEVPGTGLVIRLSVAQGDGGAYYHAACFRGAITSALAPKILAIAQHKGFSCTIMPRYCSLSDSLGYCLKSEYARAVQIISAATNDDDGPDFEDEEGRVVTSSLALSHRESALYRMAQMIVQEVEDLRLGECNDVHIGNVMLDPTTGQYVITDPLCSVF